MTQASQSSGRPLLTIAIPTYNRSGFLAQLLEILAPQLAGESRVELIISDNASPDDTPEVVASFREKGLALIYRRNETNIGPDANFLQCFEQARGEYLWLFGDDDIILPGGIRNILALLEAEDYGLVYISAYEFRRSYIAERTSDRFRRFAEILPDGLQLVKRAGTMITFISSIIINRDYYFTVPHQKASDFVGTYLIQLSWICPILADSSKNLFVWERLVAGRGGNSGGWDACQVFGINLKQISYATLGNRKDIANELCNRTLQSWFPGTIIGIRRGTGSPLDSENMREVLEPVYKKSWRYWIYVYPVIVLPLVMAQVWYSITRFIDRVMRVIHSIPNLVFSRRSYIKEPK